MSDLALPVGIRDHIQGPENAPVTLVEYGDYECSFCGRAYYIVKAIQRAMGDELRFVFRNFPLSESHRHALNAARAAEAAALQDMFWEMHDTLYEHQDALDDGSLMAFAGALGLNVEGFIRDMQSAAVSQRVREDLMSGVRSGVNGTPTFFINGKRHDGSFEYDDLLPALERKLSQSRP